MHASPFTFTGQGDTGSHELDFNISGDGFSYMFVTSEGPVTVAACSAAPCDVVSNYDAGGPLFPPSGRFHQSASLYGVSADFVSGSLGFSGSTIQAIPLGHFQVTVPVTFVGEIRALGPFNASAGQYPELFRVELSGTGQSTFSGLGLAEGGAILFTAHYEFSGTATEVEPVPEPSSGMLVATALALLLRQRLTRSS